MKRRRWLTSRPSALRRWLGRSAVGAAALAVVWSAGFLWFVHQIPDAVDDPTTPTDAVVVLTGAAGRLGEGLDLIRQNRARELFVSGVYRGVDVARLLEAARAMPGDLECCIALGHAADDTRGNAEETAAWVRERGYGSLRIVTSSYHMPRSMLEFRGTLPEVRLVPHPVFAPSFKLGRWWMWPGTTALIASEFNKYLLARVRHGIEAAVGRVSSGGG